MGAEQLRGSACGVVCIRTRNADGREAACDEVVEVPDGKQVGVSWRKLRVWGLMSE